MNGELERLAWGCLLPSFAGPAMPEWLRPWLDAGLGGVVLFGSNVAGREQLGRLTAALREHGPLLVAIDEEGGDVTRLEADVGSSYPGALALGVADEPELTRAVAREIAGRLADVGVNVNLAPVADVNSDPLNPVIGVRSFGSDPALVARHVAMHVAGTQERGVAACAKHFPGHGHTRVDSHLELPVLDRDLEALHAVELPPFRAAIDSDVRAVMTGHLLVPALDGAPATLSRVVIEELLRGELGFDGVVVSDALDMRGLGVSVEEGTVLALAAGVDAVCLGPTVGPERISAAHRAVVEAVRRGRLAEERIAAAARRRAALADWARPGPAAPGERALGVHAAARAVRVVGDVGAGPGMAVVELVPAPLVAAGRTGASLGSVVRERFPHASVHTLRGEEGLDAVQLGEGRVVVVLRDAARHPWQQRAAERVLAARPDAVLVETGVPGWKPSRRAACIETHGAGRASLEAAARLLAPGPG